MLNDLGLTPSAHAVLLTLRERGSLPLTELSAAIGTDPRNMGPVLDAIHALIQRGTSPNDRRQRTVALSALGRHIADKLADAARTQPREVIHSRDVLAAEGSAGRPPVPQRNGQRDVAPAALQLVASRRCCMAAAAAIRSPFPLACWPSGKTGVSSSPVLIPWPRWIARWLTAHEAMPSPW
jgi:DNA-binding MarR family transcriptional regulator